MNADARLGLEGAPGWDSPAGAVISSDGRYRYALWRRWDTARPLLGWCMLNPSTADAAEDDPTIRRCLAFSKREGAGGMLVVNLLAYRTSHPSLLRQAPDALGANNDAFLCEARRACAQKGVVLAWGAGAPRGAAEAALPMLRGVPLLCLGKTARGEPRHPLYLAAATPLEPYEEPSMNGWTESRKEGTR